MEYNLEDIFDLQMGKTPSRNNPDYWGTEDNKWISIADLSKCGKYIEETKEYLSDSAVEESGISLIPANTVVMSFKLSIGKTAITPEPMYSNEAIMSFRDKHVVELIPDYVYYMFSGKDWDAGTNKAVMGKTLNKATLSKVKVNIHDIEEQREIVAVLDTLSKIIDDRNTQIESLDNLIKARFVELFGDPIHPVKYMKLGDVALLERGRFSPRPRNDPRFYGGEYPFIQTGDIASSNHRLIEYKQTLNEEGIKVSRKFEVGTIVMAIVGATIGATSILQREVYAPDSVIGISPYKYDNVFLEELLQFWKPHLLAIAPESARANINLGILNDIPIMDVSVEQQNQFADFVNQVDKSKVAVQKSLDETQKLFDSLMQDFFG